MKVAAVQLRSTLRDVPANLQNAARFAVMAADSGAQLLLLPELFNTGYFVGAELFDLWEQEDGRTVEWMGELAARHRMVVAGTIPEQRGNRLFNALFLVEPDGGTHRYAKRHPSKPESAAFDAGDAAGIMETKRGSIGCVICADLNWRASLLRPMAGRIDLLLCPQAVMAPRRIAQRVVDGERKRGAPWFGKLAPAIGAPIITAGLVGNVQRMSRVFHPYMYGGTWIVDASGNGIASVGFDEEGIALAEVAVGSTGGDAQSPLLTDPGLALRLESLLLVNYGNLRPT